MGEIDAPTVELMVVAFPASVTAMALCPEHTKSTRAYPVRVPPLEAAISTAHLWPSWAPAGNTKDIFAVEFPALMMVEAGDSVGAGSPDSKVEAGVTVKVRVTFSLVLNPSVDDTANAIPSASTYPC
jgi:hypothetical protein